MMSTLEGRLHDAHKEHCVKDHTDEYKCLTLLTNHCKFTGDSSQLTNETRFYDSASDWITVTVRYGYTLVIKWIIEKPSIYSQINMSIC